MRNIFEYEVVDNFPTIILGLISSSFCGQHKRVAFLGEFYLLSFVVITTCNGAVGAVKTNKQTSQVSRFFVAGGNSGIGG